jgi:hypothetical protein
MERANGMAIIDIVKTPSACSDSPMRIDAGIMAVARDLFRLRKPQRRWR